MTTNRNDEALRELARDIHHDLEQAVLVDCDGATNYKVRQIILNRLRAATLTPRPEPAPGCYKDLAGTQPCKPGDRVALFVQPDGMRFVQPELAKRPIATETSTPQFGDSTSQEAMAHHQLYIGSRAGRAPEPAGRVEDAMIERAMQAAREAAPVKADLIMEGISHERFRAWIAAAVNAANAPQERAE